MLSCFEATQLLSQRQDRPLKLNEKTQLKLHLSLCTHCRRFSKQMRQLSSLAKQYRDVESVDGDEGKESQG